MGRMLSFSLIMVALLSVGVPTCVVLSPARSEAIKLKLHQDAERSCQCARGAKDAPGKAKCWQAFEAEIGAHGEGGTLCYPISERTVCPGSDDKGCFTVAYSIVANGGTDALCNEHEAEVAEAIYAHEIGSIGGDEATYEARFAAADARAITKMLAYARELAQGRGRDLPPQYGCVTGRSR